MLYILAILLLNFMKRLQHLAFTTSRLFLRRAIEISSNLYYGKLAISKILGGTRINFLETK